MSRRRFIARWHLTHPPYETKDRPHFPGIFLHINGQSSAAYAEGKTHRSLSLPQFYFCEEKEVELSLKNVPSEAKKKKSK